jgi:hypothetical protein
MAHQNVLNAFASKNLIALKNGTDDGIINLAFAESVNKSELIEEYLDLFDGLKKKLRKSTNGKVLEKLLHSYKEKYGKVKDKDDGTVRPLYLKEVDIQDYKAPLVSFMTDESFGQGITMPPVLHDWTDELAQSFLEKSNVLPHTHFGVTTFCNLSEKYWNGPMTAFSGDFSKRFNAKEDDGKLGDIEPNFEAGYMPRYDPKYEADLDPNYLGLEALPTYEDEFDDIESIPDEDTTDDEEL